MAALHFDTSCLTTNPVTFLFCPLTLSSAPGLTPPADTPLMQSEAYIHVWLRHDLSLSKLRELNRDMPVLAIVPTGLFAGAPAAAGGDDGLFVVCLTRCRDQSMGTPFNHLLSPTNQPNLFKIRDLLRAEYRLLEPLVVCRAPGVCAHAAAAPHLAHRSDRARRSAGASGAVLQPSWATRGVWRTLFNFPGFCHHHP